MLLVKYKNYIRVHQCGYKALGFNKET